MKVIWRTCVIPGPTGLPVQHGLRAWKSSVRECSQASVSRRAAVMWLRSSVQRSCLMASRMWHVGIQLRPESVRIVTFYMSRRVAWGEIDHFAVLPLGRYPFVGFVVLRGGRKYGTFGLSTSSWAGDRGQAKIQLAIDELNAALADWRGRPQTSGA